MPEITWTFDCDYSSSVESAALRKKICKNITMKKRGKEGNFGGFYISIYVCYESKIFL